MNDYRNREILLDRNGTWLALEGEYWIALLRLLRCYGVDASPYEPPPPGQRNYIDEERTTELIACINRALDDIPRDDLWRFYGNDPDPAVVPPHEFFSGAGVSYFETLLGFLSDSDFFLEVSEPDSEYRFLGELPCRPAC